jgi:hypothetical protein
MFKVKLLEGVKYLAVGFFALATVSCKPDYRGDGVLTRGHGLLWTPIYIIQMPEIDISKPHAETYNLGGIPPSKVFYSATLVVPSSGEITPSDRAAWGNCSFTIKKNGIVVKTRGSEFRKMDNCISGVNQYLNGLYIMSFDFTVSDPQDHWELVFECSGFESLKPVAGYILLQSGGE